MINPTCFGVNTRWPFRSSRSGTNASHLFSVDRWIPYALASSPFEMVFGFWFISIFISVYNLAWQKLSYCTSRQLVSLSNSTLGLSEKRTLQNLWIAHKHWCFSIIWHGHLRTTTNNKGWLSASSNWISRTITVLFVGCNLSDVKRHNVLNIR